MNAQNSTRPKRIAIAGGGLSGLTVAYRLAEKVRASGGIKPVITLFEASERYGGVFGTVEREGYLLETGADMFITNKPEGMRLVKDLGLEGRLINTNPEFRGSLILHRGKPVPTPEGLELMLPRKFWPFVKTPLLSIWGKMRGLCEYFVPRRVGPGEALKDESLSSFVKRRLGTEIFERIVQPMVGGIYTADPDKLSLLATLPRFLEWERDTGSLIGESLKQRGGTSSMQKQKDGASGARYGLFMSFKNGMSELLNALYEQSQPEVEYRFNSRITGIKQTADGYAIKVNDTEEVQYDELIMALPVHIAAKLTSEISAELSRVLGEIECASAAILVSCHRLEDFEHPLNAYGLVIPAVEKRKILAVSMTSRKFVDRAPEGCIELRTFMGGALQQEMLELSDEELTKIACQELTEIFGMKAAPHLLHMQRWIKAMPQYHVGHLEKVERIKSEVGKLKNFGLTSNALEGVGIPDVIASAERAVDSLWK